MASLPARLPVRRRSLKFIPPLGQLFYVSPPAVDLPSLALPTHIWQGSE